MSLSILPKIWAHWFADPSRSGGCNFELYEYKGTVKHPINGEDMYRFVVYRRKGEKDPREKYGVSEVIYSAVTIERLKSFRPFWI